MLLVLWSVFCAFWHFVFIFANNCAYMEYDNLPDNVPFEEVEKALSIAENKSSIIAVACVIVYVAFMIFTFLFIFL